jgi:hypothetical protein
MHPTARAASAVSAAAWTAAIGGCAWLPVRALIVVTGLAVAGSMVSALLATDTAAQDMLLRALLSHRPAGDDRRRPDHLRAV